MDRAKAYCDLSLGVAAAAFEATSTAVESPKDHTQQIADVLHDVTELVKVGTQTSEDTQQVKDLHLVERMISSLNSRSMFSTS
jgi:hypothetical protein